MQVGLDRLKTLLRHSEPDHKGTVIYEKPELKAVVPIMYRSRALAIGACSEKLYFSFCDYCQNPYHKAELVAFKGNMCLMSCNKTGCSKLFKIDTAVL